jgi:hypothetical protein
MGALGGNISRSDRQSPELTGQILLIDPVSVNRRINKTDSGQSCHVHSVRDICDAQPFKEPLSIDVLFLGVCSRLNEIDPFLDVCPAFLL